MVDLASVAPAAPLVLPLWGFFAALILTGGVGAAAMRLLEARNATKAASRTVAAGAQLVEVQALQGIITSVTGENVRLLGRIATFEVAFDKVRAELDAYPSKEDLIESVQKLRQQLVEQGEVPVNGLGPLPPAGEAAAS